MSKVMKIVHERIVEKMEEAIENGKNPIWKKGWKSGTINHFSGHEYRGINTLLLDPGEYITFKQIQEMQKKNPDKKIKLKKGSKSEIVVYWLWYKLKKDGEVVLDHNDEPKMFAKPFYYRVFNIEDVDGLTPRLTNENIKDHKEAYKIVEDYSTREGVVINEVKGENSAFYRPATDSITVPSKNQFKSIDSFYKTLFHELVHSTGAKNRLDRFEPGTTFGSQSYSKEELVAEIGSAMLLAESGMELDEDSLENSVAYLKGWLSVIKEDVNLIISASQQSQKATDLILNRKFEEEKDGKGEVA